MCTNRYSAAAHAQDRQDARAHRAVHSMHRLLSILVMNPAPGCGSSKTDAVIAVPCRRWLVHGWVQAMGEHVARPRRTGAVDTYWCIHIIPGTVYAPRGYESTGTLRFSPCEYVLVNYSRNLMGFIVLLWIRTLLPYR